MVSTPSKPSTLHNSGDVDQAAIKPKLSSSEWLITEGKAKLQESMLKLGLDNSKMQGKHLIDLPIDELQAEKRRVKNELKLYDQHY